MVCHPYQVVARSHSRRTPCLAARRSSPAHAAAAAWCRAYRAFGIVSRVCAVRDPMRVTDVEEPVGAALRYKVTTRSDLL